MMLPWATSTGTLWLTFISPTFGYLDLIVIVSTFPSMSFRLFDHFHTTVTHIIKDDHIRLDWT